MSKDTSSKESSSKPALYPRTLLSIVASVGGLALFLIVASSVLVSQPIGDTVRGYFYNVDDSSRKINSEPSVSQLVAESNGSLTSSPEDDRGENSDVIVSQELSSGDDKLKKDSESSDKSSGKSEDHKVTKEDVVDGNTNTSSSDPASRRNEDVVADNTYTSSSDTASRGNEPVSSIEDTKTPQPSVSNNPDSAIDSDCDLFHGNWVYDSAGPLYTNNSCPIITQMQNCQGNGRPDKDYENWRWKPSQCGIPRFDPKKFLELMRGKTLAFIGDSVARNQMESMLCILWQVEEPKNRGNKKMQRYYFRSTSTMIVRIWSSWLVHQTSEPFDYAPSGVVKLHLDLPDETFMEHITTFDVIVLSSGHWFAKQSVYILNKDIVGGQLWWPDKSKQMKINNIEAFGVSVETILTALGTHANYTGLTIVRSFSPDHYEGGAWNTGGSCTGKVKPLEKGHLVENGFTNTMHEKQVTGFNRALKKKTNGSKLKLMDITEVFSYRHDGHPGPYRSPDPNKITKRGPDGRPPPQDCLHWCMPGPVDTWNELVFEIIKREFS